MKNFFNYSFILLLTAIIMSSCANEPEAGFYTDKTDVLTGENVKFTNTSTESYSYEWDFGDGNSSKSENPAHIYENSGEYSVVLTAFSKNKNKTNTGTSVINVKANEIQFNTKKYDLSEGLIEYYGNWGSDSTLYNFDLYLYNRELLETGIGQILSIEFWSYSPTDITEGEYVFSYYLERFIYTYAVLVIDINLNTGEETFYDCSAGLIDVSHDDGRHVFDISLYTNEGLFFTAYYYGRLPIYDFSSKSKTKKEKISDFDFLPVPTGKVYKKQK